MRLEWKAPLVGNKDWQPMRATTLTEAGRELAPRASLYDVLCRDADTKELVKPSYRRNGGQICDVDNGPCSCGAWH